MQHDAAAMRDAVEGWREVLREEGRDRHLCDTASGFRQWSRDQARDSYQETWCAHRGPRGLAQATETSPLASLPPPSASSHPAVSLVALSVVSMAEDKDPARILLQPGLEKVLHLFLSIVSLTRCLCAALAACAVYTLLCMRVARRRVGLAFSSGFD